MRKTVYATSNSGLTMLFGSTLEIKPNDYFLVECSNASGFTVYKARDVKCVEAPAEAKSVIQIIDLGDWGQRKKREAEILSLKTQIQEKIAGRSATDLIRLITFGDHEIYALVQQLKNLEAN